MSERNLSRITKNLTDKGYLLKLGTTKYQTTDKIFERILALPMFYEMTNDEVGRVSGIIKDVLK